MAVDVKVTNVERPLCEGGYHTRTEHFGYSRRPVDVITDRVAGLAGRRGAAHVLVLRKNHTLGRLCNRKDVMTARSGWREVDVDVLGVLRRDTYWVAGHRICETCESTLRYVNDRKREHQLSARRTIRDALAHWMEEHMTIICAVDYEAELQVTALYDFLATIDDAPAKEQPR